jgi:hypothetical protein
MNKKKNISSIRYLAKAVFLMLAVILLASSCRVFPHKWKRKVDGYVEKSYVLDTVAIRQYFMCSHRENALWEEGEPVIVNSPLPYKSEDVFSQIQQTLSGKITVEIDTLANNRCSYGMSKNVDFRMIRNIQREVVYYFPETDGITRLIPYIIFIQSNDESDPSKPGNQIIGVKTAMFLVKDEIITYTSMSETDENWQIALDDKEALRAVVDEQIANALKALIERVNPKNQ